MEVTALCLRLMMDVLVLLAAQSHSHFVQTADTAFPRVVPDRLQFYEYDTVSISCEEIDTFSKWRVMRKINKTVQTNSSDCNTPAPSCTIYPAFERHSGEYWCENEAGERSSAVNITITAGFVILELPPRPVMEGNDVTLHCKNKKTESQHIADFYKDGSSLGTSYDSNMTIRNVSKSDEGLYRCSISGAGESPESWLTVLKKNEEPYGETPLTHSQSLNPLTLLWTVAVSLVALLLLIMGLLLCRKHQVSVCFSSGKTKPGSHSHEDHTVSVSNAADSTDVTYAVVKTHRKKRETDGSRAGTEENVIYSQVTFRPPTPD
ncbi:high affinity immunoglobulin gamma Fc receptor I isoform X2 [Lates calcarifer]|uniref:high affinity immunoglobulin gamma Fc receptor I isoform X2 n=1 Tax=Lates calcarifer TaxID=8187 RepID=UPI0021D7B7A0|nr:high affinity immunoglobulin gamma Fc receptor I isoform X2 [Lates calcarifer]